MEWNFMKKQNGKETIPAQTPKKEEPVAADAKETASTPAMSRFDMFKEHYDKRNDVVAVAIENERKRLNDYFESAKNIVNDYLKSDISERVKKMCEVYDDLHKSGFSYIHDEKFCLRSSVILGQYWLRNEYKPNRKLSIDLCIDENGSIYLKADYRDDSEYHQSPKIFFREKGIECIDTYHKIKKIYSYSWFETDTLKSINSEPEFSDFKNAYSILEDKCMERELEGQFYPVRVYDCKCSINGFDYCVSEIGKKQDRFCELFISRLPYIFEISKIQEFVSNFDEYEKDFYDKAQAFLEKDMQRVQDIIDEVPVPVEKINVAVSGTTLSVDDTIDCSIADKGDIYGVIT
jgi:hypothetical protein